jgi:hypothetical protein
MAPFISQKPWLSNRYFVTESTEFRQEEHEGHEQQTSEEGGFSLHVTHVSPV